jgi:pimeloyl-ACP methyl ester carboxylesterase
MKRISLAELVLRCFLIVLIFDLVPFKYAMTQDLYWVFSHGIRADGSGFNTLRSSLGVTSTSIADDYNWKGQTLANQAVELAKDINAISTVSTKKLVVVGHSQGGLRVRQYVQQTGDGATYRADRDRVRGLAVIGTPNYGAPIANNGPILVAQAFNSVAAVFTYGVWLPGAYAALQPPIYSASQWIIDDYVGAAIDEMRPDSTFVNRLNNAPQQSCNWQSYTHRHYFLWWSWSETHWYEVCEDVDFSGFKPIPSNVATMNIIGQNSHFDNWVRASFPPILDRQFWAVASTAISALLWALALTTFGATIPAAIAFTNLAIFLWALPAMWARALGSDKNDILIPEYSQTLRWKERSPGNIGGDPNFSRVVKLPKAYHSGTFANTTTYTTELKDPSTLQALKDLRDRVLAQ